MRFKIERELLDALDDEFLVQYLGIPIGDETRAPEGDTWDAYSTNPHLSRAQVSIALISEALVEVLNGGFFQLIMNPSGGFIPDLPTAFREVGRPEEAKILDGVVAIFPDEKIIRDHDKRVAFASTAVVPGGWEGASAATKTELMKKLKTWEVPFADLIQSPEFFDAVAAFIRNQPESFEITD